MTQFQKLSFQLNGDLLTSAYGVYIIEFTHPETEKIYYVGQTGDAKHISARSPFYRLAAHLQHLKSSTQNQVNKGLREEFNLESQEEFEKVLNEAILKIHFYKTDEFDFNISREQHVELRRKTLALETALLKLLNENDINTLNKNGVTYKDYTHMNEQAKNIINEIGLSYE